MTVDVDKLLRRRLYLQRYVTSLLNDAESLIKPGDKELVTMLIEFIGDADERTLAAFSKQRTSNTEAAAALSGMLAIVASQRDLVTDMMREEMTRLIERELVVTSDAIQTETPSSRGLSTLPIAGQGRDAIIAAVLILYATRLVSEVTQAAATGPDAIPRLIRGTRSQDYRNGLLFWRNNALRKEIDLVVNGTASNVAEHVYSSASVQMLDHVSTLDFRVCLTCRSYEENGPYATGTQPRIPVHRNCRCLNLPHRPDGSYERPYVRDTRSVKDIPKAERAGKIGQTRDTIEQFFSRMTDAERRSYMGPARAQLWKDGKITNIKQLVDQVTGEPLRLDQLPE